MSTNRCPACGTLNSIEFGGKLWLDDVYIKETHDDDGEVEYEITDATPSGSADDPDTGLVWTDDCYLRCKECDTDFEMAWHSSLNREFFERWSFTR